MKHFFTSAACLFLMGFSAMAQVPRNIVINANKTVAKIEPTMWGVFFEDINFGADGGIYAELIKNRSFEFFKPLMGWKIEQKPFVEGAVTVLNRAGENLPNPRFLRVKSGIDNQAPIALVNEGFRGMGIKEKNGYDFSVQSRTAATGLKLHIELLDAKNNQIGSTVLAIQPSADFSKQTIRLFATANEKKGQCRIWLEGKGTIDLDMISLFPEDTWKKRPGGMRADMIQLLADMKPGFIRFPGGCIVEGFDLSQRYQWKKTIGPIEDRQLIINRWNFEFSNRNAPDYFQTFGLGFFEYFQLAEDIGATPLPILNCGMACQFNSAEFVQLDQLDPYVQDALDLIEFANGPVSSVWGAKRAAMGHPEPFHLKFLGIGNENWGPQYVERLAHFQKAIKAKYPEIHLVTSSGTDPSGARYEYLNKELRSMNADIIDEHFYRNRDWFLQNAKRYDTFPRTGSKVMAGEYASHADGISGNKKNNWQSALSEAAFMTGLERNADVVQLASYAPLFAHLDAWQWAPDLIWVDNLQSYGTPEYHVQKLYSLNKGNKAIATTWNNQVIAGQDSLYASSVIDTVTHELIIKLVNVSLSAKQTQLQLEGIKKMLPQAELILLSGNEPTAINSIDQPMLVAPKTSSILFKKNKLDYELPASSFVVIKIKMQ
jgi:alpha-L-arabinofuranosidase